MNQEVSERELFHGSDITRLVEVAEKEGFELSRADAQWVWEDFSDSMAAGWMGMDHYGDEYLWSIITYRMEPDETGKEN